MNNVKVSIIMPSLNVAEYIRESLDSAINQTLKEIEIICIDAGSTDGTLEIIEEFVEKDTRVRLIKSPIKSYGYQMNLGISKACGEYIGIIETDDYVKPEMYEQLYEIAEKQQVDFVKASRYDFTMTKGISKVSYVKVDSSGKYCNRVINPAEEQEIFRLGMNTWTGIYKRDFLLDNNIKYNETPGAAYQDQGFWFKTFCCATRVYFINNAYYMYRRDNPNASTFYKATWLPTVVSEYNYIYKWLKDNEIIEIFKGPFLSGKYKNLMLGFDKTPENKKIEYSQIFADEIVKHIRADEYVQGWFSLNEWEWIQVLINNPMNFCVKRICYLKDINDGQIKRLMEKIENTENKLKNTENKLKASLSREKSLENSVSFRIGRAITWGPRKIRGGVRCYNQHGVSYTIKRIGWHITHLK